VLLALIFTLIGCGGGGGSSATVSAPTSVDETGTLVIGLTDAEGEFVSYTVDVVAITLQKASGSVVEALPLKTRVDFAELTEVTELVTASTVPVGVYESVNLTLDYSDAEILVQNDQGDTVAAEARDESGDLLEQITLALNLTSSDYIRIRRGIPAAFSLDFDLDASNEIDLDVSPAVVTVAPFLLATPELEADREHRVRGLLADVNAADAEITLQIRPFWRRVGEFGRFTFQVEDTTAFEVDGQPLDASAGLAAMADLPPTAPVVAHGSIRAGEFVAEAVLAGTSVPWSDTDAVRGVVSARNGDTLTLRGARVYAAAGARSVFSTFTVTVGPDTAVTALAENPGSLERQNISVGQRIVAFGQLSGSVSEPMLDATEGRVRLRISGLSGEVISVEPLVIDLYLLSGRRPAVFDFSGTGVSPQDDADPQAYQISTSGLPLDQVQSGELVRVRGRVNDFGAAPLDFLARSVTASHLADQPATFVALWPEPAAAAVSEISDMNVALDLSAARSALKLIGWRFPGVTDLDAMNLLAPASGEGVYALRIRGTDVIHVFRSFADMSTALLEELQAGSQLRRVAAHGRYNAAQELTTPRAAFELVAADQ